MRLKTRSQTKKEPTEESRVEVVTVRRGRRWERSTIQISTSESIHTGWRWQREAEELDRGDVEGRRQAERRRGRETDRRREEDVEEKRTDGKRLKAWLDGAPVGMYRYWQ